MFNKLLKSICFVIIFFIQCSYNLIIEVGGSDPFQPSFHFKKKPDSNKILKEVKINKFVIYTINRLDTQKINNIWTIETKPGQNIALNSVEYGKVPHGFTETIQPKELGINTKYFIFAIGNGWNAGNNFIIINKDGNMRLVTENIQGP